MIQRDAVSSCQLSLFILRFFVDKHVTIFNLIILIPNLEFCVKKMKFVLIMSGIDIYLWSLQCGANYGCGNVVARNAFMRGFSKYFHFYEGF